MKKYSAAVMLLVAAPTAHAVRTNAQESARLEKTKNLQALQLTVDCDLNDPDCAPEAHNDQALVQVERLEADFEAAGIECDSDAPSCFEDGWDCCCTEIPPIDPFSRSPVPDIDTNGPTCEYTMFERDLPAFE